MCVLLWDVRRNLLTRRSAREGCHHARMPCLPPPLYHPPLRLPQHERPGAADAHLEDPAGRQAALVHQGVAGRVQKLLLGAGMGCTVRAAPRAQRAVCGPEHAAGCLGRPFSRLFWCPYLPLAPQVLEACGKEELAAEAQQALEAMVGCGGGGGTAAA